MEHYATGLETSFGSSQVPHAGVVAVASASLVAVTGEREREDSVAGPLVVVAQQLFDHVVAAVAVDLVAVVEPAVVAEPVAVVAAAAAAVAVVAAAAAAVAVVAEPVVEPAFVPGPEPAVVDDVAPSVAALVAS